MALNITITDAGRAELINADNTGTAPVKITHVAFTETAFTASKSQKSLPGEILRLSSIAGEVVAPDTISVTAKDEGGQAYTVRGFGLITDRGTLFAVYSQADPIIEKASPSTLLLTIDVVLADIDAAHLEFGDISFSNPPASLTTPGVVTLSNATDSTAQNQASTPRAVKAANDNANTRLAKNQNLADLTNAAAARVNLGLGISATLGNTASRTSSSTSLLLQAAAMNDHRKSGDHDDRYPQRSNNLSDLPSSTQARRNLGLGDSATRNIASNSESLEGNSTGVVETPAGVRKFVNQYGIAGPSPRATSANDAPADFDLFIKPGSYTVSGPTLHGPNGNGTHTGILEVYERHFGSILQVFTDSSDTNYHRYDIGRDWTTEFNNKNLSPVEDTRRVDSGDGMAGGGRLDGNRTLSVDSSVLRTRGKQVKNAALTFNSDSYNDHLKLERNGNDGVGITLSGLRLVFRKEGITDRVDFEMSEARINDRVVYHTGNLSESVTGDSAPFGGWRRDERDGFIEQWNGSAIVGADQTITIDFPIGFTRDCFKVFASIENSFGGDDDVFARVLDWNRFRTRVRAERTPNAAIGGTRRIHIWAMGV